MTFTLDDTGGGEKADDGGEMSFGVVDTEAAVKEAAASKKEEIDLIRVIQRNPFLKQRRVEFSPFLGGNLNDSLVDLFVAGGSLNYHLNEVMGIGLHGAYSLGSETDLFDKMIEDYGLFPEVSKVQWYASLHFQYAPLYGKFALFNSWIIPWDAYALLAAGYTRTELSGHPTLSAGIGQRYFFNRWFALNFELRDHIFNEEYPGGSVLVNNLMVTGGVSFFLPFDFKYRMLK